MQIGQLATAAVLLCPARGPGHFRFLLTGRFERHAAFSRVQLLCDGDKTDGASTYSDVREIDFPDFFEWHTGEPQGDAGVHAFWCCSWSDVTFVDEDILSGVLMKEVQGQRIR